MSPMSAAYYELTSFETIPRDYHDLMAANHGNPARVTPTDETPDDHWIATENDVRRSSYANTRRQVSSSHEDHRQGPSHANTHCGNLESVRICGLDSHRDRRAGQPMIVEDIPREEDPLMMMDDLSESSQPTKTQPIAIPSSSSNCWTGNEPESYQTEDQASFHYEMATWRMYYRIIEYRRQNLIQTLETPSWIVDAKSATSPKKDLPLWKGSVKVAPLTLASAITLAANSNQTNDDEIFDFEL